MSSQEAAASSSYLQVYDEGWSYVEAYLAEIARVGDFEAR